MKKFESKIIIILICLAFTSSFQSIFGQDWIRYYGTTYALGCTAIETYDHGYIFQAKISGGDIWIFKTDINGNILWEKVIGSSVGNVYFSPVNIEQTVNNGLIICGTTNKYGSPDAFLIQINYCGEVDWCKIIKRQGPWDVGFKVKPTPEGDFILLGGYYPTEPRTDYSLFKFNENGELIWQQYYVLDGYTSSDCTKDLLIDTDGYLIISSGFFPDTGAVSPYLMRSCFMKSDTAGIKLWDLIYNPETSFSCQPFATVKNNFGNYFHSCSHSTDIGVNPSLLNINHYGPVTLEHDIIITGNKSVSSMNTITMMNDTNIVFFGKLDANQTHDGKVIITDTTGNLLNSKTLIPINNFNSTFKTYDNKFVSVADNYFGSNSPIVAVKINSNLEYDSIYTQPFTYDSLCPHPIVSDTIDPNCDNVLVSVDEPFKKPETTQLKVYPNPTDSKLTIELPKYLVVTNNSGNIPATTIYHQWSSATLQAIDLQGKTVLQQEVAINGVPLQLDVSKLPAGMYQFRLLYMGKLVAGSKVVVK